MKGRPLIEVLAPTTPAAAIHNALQTTTAKAAALVGEHPTAWSMYRHGKRTPSTTKVQSWLDALAANGRSLVLRWGADGCEATHGYARVHPQNRAHGRERRPARVKPSSSTRQEPVK